MLEALRRATAISPGIAGGDRRSVRHGLIVIASFALCLAALASLAIGPTGISLDALPLALAAIVSGAADPAVQQAKLVLLEIRVPRTLIGMFVGSALAVSGAMMQGLFRNPLADPGIIGVSAGAALAAVATIALSDTLVSFWVVLWGIYALPVSAFLGGILTTFLLVFLAGRGGSVMMGTLLLAGIALAALAGALTGLIAFWSDDRELRDLTLWTMGSLAGSSWEKVAAIAPFAVLLAIGIPKTFRILNGLLLGEAEAFHMGVDVERAKILLVVLTALAVGAAVAVAGVIGFAGIVVPHFVRLITGPDHRYVMPASALIGATIILIADIFARIVVQPAELPIGIIMAMIGAPVFLHLVLRRGMAG